MARLILRLAAFALIALVLDPRAASAHAGLVESTPADGAVLAQAPDFVLLTFNEPVRPIRVEVLDRTGRVRTTAADLEVVGPEVSLLLPPALEAGTYVVSYRVTSLDAHPVAGSLLFSIGSEPPPAEHAGIDEDTARERAWRIAFVLDRAVYSAALLGTAGLVFFIWLVTRAEAAEDKQLRRILGAGTAIAAPTALLAVGLEGALLQAGPPGALFSAEAWLTAAESTLAVSLLVGLVGLAALVLALLVLPRSVRWPAAGLAAITMVGSLTLTGHAATADPRWAMSAALAVHAAMIAFWIGSLVALAVLLSNDEPVTLAPLIRRFSGLAVPVVALLAGAGLVLAAVQLGSLHGLVGTHYGRLLLLKLAVFAALLGLATWNKLRLTPALREGSTAALRQLRLSVRLELGCVAVILLVTAFMGQSPPPRTLHEAANQAEAHAFSTMAESGGYAAMVEVSPAVAGTNRIEIMLHDAAGQPFEALKVELKLSHAGAGMEPITRTATPTSPGTFVLSGSELAMAGDWNLRIEALISDFEKVTLETTVTVASP